MFKAWPIKWKIWEEGEGWGGVEGGLHTNGEVKSSPELNPDAVFLDERTEY